MEFGVVGASKEVEVEVEEMASFSAQDDACENGRRLVSDGAWTWTPAITNKVEVGSSLSVF